MKVLVCGSRGVKDRYLVYSTLDEIHDINGIDLVIEGCARGADTLAEEWALHANIPNLHFPVTPEEWETIGKSAGHRRNRRMLQEHPDLVVAFWDGQSAGTAGTIKSAEAMGLTTLVVPT